MGISCLSCKRREGRDTGGEIGGANPRDENSEGHKDRQLIKLTLWSFSGGRTIVLSMLFSTIFHSSFRTRFSTVFSQILANNIKLQRGREREREDDCQVGTELTCLRLSLSRDVLVKGRSETPSAWWNESSGFGL